MNRCLWKKNRGVNLHKIEVVYFESSSNSNNGITHPSRGFALILMADSAVRYSDRK
jgi:hypothetical protein